MTTIIGMSQFCKILFGLTSDAFPLFGSKRKSYAIIMSTVLVVTLMLTWLDVFNTTPSFVAAMFAISLANTSIDVIADAFSASESRRDPYHGSEEI